MAELLHDSTQIFKCNMLDRYLDCPLLPFVVKSVQFWIFKILLFESKQIRKSGKWLSAKLIPRWVNRRK